MSARKLTLGMDKARKWKRGCIVLMVFSLVLVGVTAWLACCCGNQPQYQNRSISLLNYQLNQLQKVNANLTATLTIYRTQFMQCKSNLTRIKEQLTKELAQCQVERKKCESQLPISNLSTVHGVHGCWIILSIFCFMLLLN